MPQGHLVIFGDIFWLSLPWAGVVGRVHGWGEHPTVHRRVPSTVTYVNSAALENSTCSPGVHSEHPMLELRSDETETQSGAFGVPRAAQCSNHLNIRITYYFNTQH